MDSAFVFNCVLTFLVGSLWITFTTVLAERLGSQIGGWLAGLPSIIVVTLLFIGVTQSTDAAVQATTIVPLSMCFSGLFLVIYALLSPFSFSVAITVAFLVWFAHAVVTAVLHWADYAVAMVIFVAGLCLWYLVLERMKLGTAGEAKIRYTAGQILGRAIFSGGIMVSAVVVSRVAGPILGGSFSAFPGVFASTCVITYQSRGLAFSRAITQSLMVSGLTNVVVYASAVRFLYPVAGIAAGTVLAYAISMVSGYATYRFINRKRAPS